MKRLLQSLAIAAMVTPACAPEPGRRSTVGPEGGVITSDDGRLTMTVPRGALTDDVRITIGRTESQGDLCYELGPDGTDFRVPAVVTYRAPVSSEWSFLRIENPRSARVCPRSS